MHLGRVRSVSQTGVRRSHRPVHPADGRMTPMRWLALPLLALAACAPEPPVAQQEARRPEQITILFTTDEHGWLRPHNERGRMRGGAAEVLGMWVANEGHCPGPPGPSCPNPSTLALSGGDNYTGPAISTYFD